MEPWWHVHRHAGTAYETSLTCLKEAESLQMANNLLWFQNRQTAHGLCDCHLLSADKLGFKMRLAVIEKQ